MGQFEYPRTTRRYARNAGRSILFEDLLMVITGEESHGSRELPLRASIHEAGHAIATLSFPELLLDHVTIVGSNDAAGGTAMGVRRGKPMTVSALDAFLVAIVAGRAAEEIL
ncbi:hypothetical protein [Acidocella sp.]|uniref:hypothetical protein n=1 Tax=Acidocella sp. TaxID=50710 RepID=UPI002608B856|nr:hypothetical protein [Acidocella sp.]MDD2794288.1 hypothetical protein [Acidocella sp.]